jgi:5-bromo-4-chloroindolyl phosphate hydrolysis protein
MKVKEVRTSEARRKSFTLHKTFCNIKDINLLNQLRKWVTFCKPIPKEFHGINQATPNTKDFFFQT